MLLFLLTGGCYVEFRKIFGSRASTTLHITASRKPCVGSISSTNFNLTQNLNLTQYFFSYERKTYASSCCFEHIKMRNFMRHKAPKNNQLLKSRMSEWSPLIIVSAKSLMIAYYIIIEIWLMEYSIKIGYFSVIIVLTETFVSHQTTKFNKQI